MMESVYIYTQLILLKLKLIGEGRKVISQLLFSMLLNSFSLCWSKSKIQGQFSLIFNNYSEYEFRSLRCWKIQGLYLSHLWLMEGFQKYEFNIDLSSQCTWLDATSLLSSEKLYVSTSVENDSIYKIRTVYNTNHSFLRT